MVNLVILDRDTLGDLDVAPITDQVAEARVFARSDVHQLPTRLADAEIAVTNKVVLDASVLARAPRLKLICVAATGTNNVDLTEASRRGISVCNVPGYSTASVVSHTFALYFQLAHQLRYHDTFTKSGAWSGSGMFTHLQRPFSELAGKHWGVIGLGTIGLAVARTAAAFGCRVSYHSTSGRNLDRDYPHQDLFSLLAACEVVSIHAPLNPATHHLIGAEALAIINPMAILINVARGGIIDESALAKALDRGQLAGAGIDVLPEEPPPADHPLFHLQHPERLIVTPHIAGLSIQARTRLIAEVAANVHAFLAGKPRNLVGS